MSFKDELLYILSGDGVGIPLVNMFATSAKFLPKGPGPLLSVISTGGTSPDQTHNKLFSPAYLRPSAQIVCRADDYADAETMLFEAMTSLYKIRNEYIGSGIFGPTGTWFRSISLLQSEPIDLGLGGDDKRVRVAFNILGDKRPSFPFNLPAGRFLFEYPPEVAMTIYQMIEVLGGSAFSFFTPGVADAYPIGVGYDALVPDSYPVELNAVELYLGTYILEASARVDLAGARVKLALFDLTNAPNTPIVGSEITFTSGELVGERKRSGSFTIPSADTLLGVKLTTDSALIGGAAWGCRILRV